MSATTIEGKKLKVEGTTIAAPPRFIVGIDLGTTNCALAFVDTKNGRAVQDFVIDQFTAPGVREKRDTLPSFVFFTPENGEKLVGLHARDHGALTPGRQISSAKSWLCHAGVDRTSPILPWHAAEGVQAISPVEAQTAILRHLHDDWNAAHPDHPLAEQDVHITVPASFDEVARELTIEAAKRAGLPRIMLIEEPQAAFYAWLSRHEKQWESIVGADDHVLVIDVGGGTTDFTLIHARPSTDGRVMFHRTAVGDHLILGGDNLDLALAHLLEPRLAGGGKLDARSWTTLVRICRHYKEMLLGENPPESVSVVLPGRGAGLLGGQKQTTLACDEAVGLLLDGFMPRVGLDASPSRHVSGFQEFGLPYASDPAITHHLATFLRENLPKRTDGSITPPAAVLLNGGLFESAQMRARVMELLGGWFAPAKPKMLDHQRLDLAVARGAAYFGLTGRGEGVRVVSHLARSYYIGVEGRGTQALCLAPAGLPAGSSLRLDQQPLGVRLKTPVAFPVYVSSRRTTDRAGDLVDIDREFFTALPPIRTVLTAGKQATQTMIDIALKVNLTEIGTLDLHLVEVKGSRAWKLAFDVRAATRTELDFHEARGEAAGFIESSRIADAADYLKSVFELSAGAMGQVSVFRQLEDRLGIAREQWPVSALRALWEVLYAAADVRSRSATHEQRWLNLTGYCLRPGFGLAIDDWRVAEMWKLFHAGPVNRSQEAVRAEWWILWRRLAGGLSAGQQQTIGAPLVAALKQLSGGKSRARLPSGWDIRPDDHETREMIRLLAMLERFPAGQKILLGSILLGEGQTRFDAGLVWWAIGRLGARSPSYAPIHHVIPAETAAQWINHLLQSSHGDIEVVAAAESRQILAFSLMLLARRTGDRYRDIDEKVRDQTLELLERLNASPHWVNLVREGGELSENEAGEAFGESLPMGLLLT